MASMSTMMMDRGAMTGMSGMGTGTMGATGMGVPTGMNMMMVPRCTMKMEKCDGGMVMTCTSDDPMACSMMQNLCTMMAGGMCSCYMMMNGMTVCCCNMMMGMCKCEMIDKGVKITCTSGDKSFGAMIQACCDCMASMMGAGCACCVTMNNTPVCCSC